MAGKRKRPASSKGSKRPTKKGKTTFKKGRDRTGGFFGRYQGMGREQKFFDTAIQFSFDSTAETAATAVLGQLDLIPQGVTESTRVGRKCIIRSIQLKCFANCAFGAAANGICSTNMWLVLDKQANGAQAAFTDIFDSATLYLANVDLANSQRFRILKKWKHDWNSTAGVTTAYNSVTKSWDYYKKCNIPLEFSSTTGAITELKSNHIFLAYGAVFGDDLVQLSGIARLRFDD